MALLAASRIASGQEHVVLPCSYLPPIDRDAGNRTVLCLYDLIVFDDAKDDFPSTEVCDCPEYDRSEEFHSIRYCSDSRNETELDMCNPNMYDASRIATKGEDSDLTIQTEVTQQVSASTWQCGMLVAKLKDSLLYEFIAYVKDVLSRFTFDRLSGHSYTIARRCTAEEDVLESILNEFH